MTHNAKKYTIRILLTIVLLSIFACNKSETKETLKIDSLESLSDFVYHSKNIRDSIKKFKDQKLLICTKRNMDKNTIISLTPSCIPFYIENEYLYKSIDGVNIIFYEYDKPLTHKKHQSGLKDLLKKNIVKIETSNRTCCIPSYNFAFCNDNPTEINCFDGKMIEEEIIRNYKAKKNVDPEKVFFPKCEE
ncbi:hypothetical protein [Flavobacterium terrisoli]|uniref:hypothetical protein n=1 Tax=Flavobacterium terrisoli TaxID=3242195 RepID=UPI002543DDFC|nr:hypothetical protein [Flavobacterium buctense]